MATRHDPRQLSLLAEPDEPDVAPAPARKRRSGDAAAVLRGLPPDELPGMLGELQRLVGRDVVATLVDQCGGTSVWVPRTPAAGNRLTRMVGHDAARVLIERYADDKLYIPSLQQLRQRRRNADIRRAYDRGTPVTELARRHGLSERRIWTILGESDQ